MTGGLEFGSNDILKPVSQTGYSKSEKYDNSILEGVKNRTKVSQILDGLEIPEKNQKDLVNKILKYSNKENFNKILNDIENFAYNENDVLNILKKEEIGEKKEEIGEKKEQIGEKKEQIGEKSSLEKKQIDDLLGSIKGLDINNKDYGSIINKIKKLDQLNSTIEDYKSILNDLKNDGGIKFSAIIQDLGGVDSENYKIFKSSLINIDSDFRNTFDRFELGTNNNVAKLKLGTDNLNGVDLSKNELRQEKDGAVIEAGKNSRNLSLVGSDYKLDSKLQNNSQKNSIQEVETNLKNDLKPINETLNNISSVIDYLDKAILNNVELKDIKENIKNTNIDLYTELNIENLNSPSDIKNAFIGLQIQKQKEKDSKIKEAKQKISLFIKQNSDIAKEQDEKKKDILRFLTSIGFDKIPQSITSQLIKELQSNIFTLGELNLNLKTIDLDNGRFGETENESSGTKWKQNLVKFMEKLVYGEIGTQDSIFASKTDKFTGVFGARLNSTELNFNLEKNGVKVGTGWDINRMKQNLSKVKKD